jgi:hypothetical protein
MRTTLILISLLALTACTTYVSPTAGKGDNHPAVCQQQSDLARNGLVDGRPQSISCPDHGIGTRRNY